MKVEYEDKIYDLDFDEVTVQQAKVIKVHCGLSLKALEEGLAEGDADALRALFWLMSTNSGDTVSIDTIDFKIVKFSRAIQEAAEKERLANEEKDKIDAAEMVAAGRRPKAKTTSK